MHELAAVFARLRSLKRLRHHSALLKLIFQPLNRFLQILHICHFLRESDFSENSYLIDQRQRIVNLVVFDHIGQNHVSFALLFAGRLLHLDLRFILDALALFEHR